LAVTAAGSSGGRATGSRGSGGGSGAGRIDGARPIMALLDLLGRRWALRLIWELRSEQLRFRALQERCEGVSSSVLNQRLQELRDAGAVEHGAEGYRLTEEGRRLLEAYRPLNAWAERWAERTERSDRPEG
jgi:DNA-binding HxlR family transcriptional regulator